MDEQNAINIVRLGVVSSIDRERLRVSVIYPSMDNMVSGWLYVPQRGGGAVTIKADGKHRHSITVDGTQAETTETGEHEHKDSVTGTWLPEINDTVLVLYQPTFNGDGFILGVI